jgi:ABC-type glutathione transport system ATPase component
MLRALDAVDMAVHAGEVVGLLGESGCDKSTLASAILRLLPFNARHDGGTVLLEERDLLRLSESNLRAIRGARISLIWQDPALSLNPVIAVGNQVTELLRAHSNLDRCERRASLPRAPVRARFYKASCIAVRSDLQWPFRATAFAVFT